ncbi:unnamed protein product [Candidula unifasciata]|uniref:Uncharacterized protein n=1 Tax=Candidula unifasciata TaxID=100452 RepID=A0A8S3Z4Y3_9EUPU|nr:unnamed protein product [Candidula unifasciata]
MWVQELFAPVYDFEAIVVAGKYGYKHEERKPLRVPILDPETIREVFDKVHQRIVKAEEKLLQEQTEKERKKDEELDPHKSSVWNTEELDTLRKVYKSATGQLKKLEVALNEQTEYNKSMVVTIAKQRKEIDKLKAKLSEVTLANQRLCIHKDSLLKDQAVQDVRLAAVTDMWHENEKEKLKAWEEVKTTHMMLEKERLWRQKLEAELLESKHNLLREIQLVERKAQTKREMEVNDLNEVIRDLVVELRDEKKLHDASKRGLQHLRKHFSSLPLQHIIGANAVTEDEVQHIDHYNL